jgi:Leucine-rich repeat (LRR) protein
MLGSGQRFPVPLGVDVLLTPGSILLLLLALCLPVVLPADTTLEAYARANPLTVYTATERKEKTLPLAPADQINNLAVGNKLLTLSGKGLTSLDGITKLRVIDGGREVPLKDVKNLQIFLNDNALSRLPDELFGMQNVIFLYFNHNQFDAIPPEIARMKALQGMYFTANRIRRIPPEVFTMTWLRKLQVSKNHLTELPEALGNLTNLIHLNLSENEIPALPDSVAKLTKLRVCDFSDNRISRLPEGFGQVKILYQLRVRNNPLTSLPSGFENMPATIDITGTRIDPARLSPAMRAKISTGKAPKPPAP